MKTILLTGTSSGIGNGLAHELLKRGNAVFGISRRTPADLNEKENYRHLELDLCNFALVSEKLPKFISDIQKLDLLILNSGILGDIKYMDEQTVDDMKRVFEINVWANKHLLDLVFGLGPVVKQVVGMSSKAALRSSPGWGPYAMSKAGLKMLMDIYANEVSETHFISFAPGLVDSEIQDTIYAIKDTDKYPSAKTLQDARYTETMPDAHTAAPVLIDAMNKALQYESGSHIDVREM